MFIMKPYKHVAQITHASVHCIKHAVIGPIVMNQMQTADFQDAATAKYQLYYQSYLFTN